MSGKWLFSESRLLYAGLLFLFGIAASCHNTGEIERDVKQLESEVLKIHDEVMPRMGEVIALTAIMDSLSGTEANQSRKDSFHTVAGLLRKADQDMMHWMRSYVPPEKPFDSTDILYLEKERIKIKKVSARILEGISRANEFKNK